MTIQRGGRTGCAGDRPSPGNWLCVYMRMASFKRDSYRPLPPVPTPPPGPQLPLPLTLSYQPASFPRDRMPDWAARIDNLPERDEPSPPTPVRPHDPPDRLDL